MPIPVVSFQPNTFEQSNPVLRGAQLAQQLYRGNIENAIYPQMAQQELLAKQLANALSRVQVQYAEPMTQATLAEKQEMAPHLRALTGLTQEQTKYFGPKAMSEIQQALANAGLTREQTKYFGPTALANIHQTMANTQKELLGNELFRKTMPYAERNAQGSTYTDPILNRAYQMTIAQQSGEIPQELMGSVGIGNQQGAPASPYGNNIASLLGQSPALQGGLPPTAAPKFNSSQSGLANWLLRGTPLGYEEEAKLKSLQTRMNAEATQGVTQQTKALEGVSDAAQEAKDLRALNEQFVKNYKEGRFTGRRLGLLPSRGIFSVPLPGNLEHEQNADNAANNLSVLIAQMMSKRMLTNQELNMSQKLKFGRDMEPQTVDMLHKFLNAKSDRVVEHQRFMNEAIRKHGLDADTAKNLWSLYENERPIFDFEKNKANSHYKNTWKDYLTPKAIQRASEGAELGIAPQGISSGVSDEEILAALGGQ